LRNRFSQQIEPGPFGGTPEFMAPEVITGIGHTTAVDWWTLGVIIYEMLAGYPPFVGGSVFETYSKICEANVVFPDHFSKTSKDIVSQFLVSKPVLRLGNRNAGAKEIKMHKFFKGMDWKTLEKRQIVFHKHHLF